MTEREVQHEPQVLQGEDELPRQPAPPVDPYTPEPGPYKNARTPYLIDIQLTMSPGSPWREGWWIKPHQVGGSV